MNYIAEVALKIKESKRMFAMSFFITLLVAVVFALCVYVTYRIESMINADPIVIFTLTDHSDGTYSYTFFNCKGDIDLSFLDRFK